MLAIDPRVNRLSAVTITASPTETTESSGDSRVDALIDQLLQEHPPATTKPAETRMGGGKGSPDHWVAVE